MGNKWKVSEIFFALTTVWFECTTDLQLCHVLGLEKTLICTSWHRSGHVPADIKYCRIRSFEIQITMLLHKFKFLVQKQAFWNINITNPLYRYYCLSPFYFWALIKKSLYSWLVTALCYACYLNFLFSIYFIPDLLLHGWTQCLYLCAIYISKEITANKSTYCTKRMVHMTDFMLKPLTTTEQRRLINCIFQLYIFLHL